MGCPYADIFGKPNTGAHTYRVFGFAVVDTLATILVAWLIHYVWKTEFWTTLVVFFVVGEILHYGMGVQTQFLTTLGVTAPTC